jgi:hypothetical protein
MAYSILEQLSVAGKNIDALNKSAKFSGSALENGNVVSLGALSTTSGEEDVFVAATPATATLATAIYWMVYEPPIPVTDSAYVGLTDDPTKFNIAANKVFGVYKPKVGDEIIISTDGLGGSKSSNTYIVPADNTAELTWASSTSGVTLAYELLDTTTIKVPSSTFYGASIVAYRFRCVLAQ